MLALFASAASSQFAPPHFVPTYFDNSNGQFRQEFFDTYGNAHGVYSYINPSGQVVRVQYSTGVSPSQPPPPQQQIFTGFPAAPLPRYEPSTENSLVPQKELYSPKNNVAIPVGANLFTPAVVQYPAATAGQLDNYRKALEEYAAQEKES